MKRILISVFMLAFTALPGVALAENTLTVTGCNGTFATIKNLAANQSYTKTISNQAVEAGGNDSIKLTGNNDCVLAGANSSVTINGNQAQITATNGSIKLNGNHGTITVTDSYVKVVGNNVTITSNGGSYINGGGNTCNTDDTTDYTVNCL